MGDREPEVALNGGGSTSVHRRGDVVLRQARPWSRTTIALLRHLEDSHFGGSPRVVGAGFSLDGREALQYVDGLSPHPGPWSDQAVHGIGRMLRQLHDAAANFNGWTAAWMPWWGRGLPDDDRVIGHCDLGPWNILMRNGLPVVFLDWDTAGPVGRRWDLAQTAWLNAQLHDDDVAERYGLPPASARSRQLRIFCEGYGMSGDQRGHLVGDMISVAVRSAAQEAVDSGVTPEGTVPGRMSLSGGGQPFDGHDLAWALTWRIRSARWMLDHRGLLEQAVE